MKAPRKFRRSFYLFKGESKFRLTFRGKNMALCRMGGELPDDELHEVVQWVIASTEEVRKELGHP